MKAFFWWQVRPVDIARAGRGGRRRLRPDEAALRAYYERRRVFWDGTRHYESALEQVVKVWRRRRGTYKWPDAYLSRPGRRKYARAPFAVPFKALRVVRSPGR